MPARNSATINIRGCGLNMARTGAGAPVLLLHGAGGSRMLGPVQDRLSAGYDVLLPDHPGFGASDTPGWITSVADIAFFYLDLLDQLDLGGVHLIGHSLGGWIAAEIAIRNTRRIASLTLIAAAGIHVKGVAKGDIFLWSPEETVRNLFCDEAIVAAELAREPTEAEIETAIKNRTAAAKYAWNPRLHNPDLHKWLHRVDVPALIVWGAGDKVFPADYADAFGALIEGAKIEIIPAAGHLPFADQREDFFARLNGFLDGVAP